MEGRQGGRKGRSKHAQDSENVKALLPSPKSGIRSF